MAIKTTKPATMKDVARASGYSVYTVSSVLNNKGDISAKATAQVLSAARKLNYHLLGNVSAARRITTQSVGIVLPGSSCLHHDFYNRAISTFRTLATTTDHDCQLFTEDDLIRKIATDRPDGIQNPGCKGLMVFCPNQDFHRYLKPILRMGVAVALIRRQSAPHQGLFQAVDDDYQGMHSLLEYLYHQAGARRLVLVSKNILPARQLGGRERAFITFCKNHLPEEDCQATTDADWVNLKKARALKAFIKEGKRIGKKVAVCCWTDENAVRLLMQLNGLGLSVPRDLYLTGYGNDRQSQLAVPAVTTMNIPVEEMVTSACRYLFEHRVGAPLPPAATKNYDHELLIRDSSGCRTK